MALSLNHFSIRTLDLAATQTFYVSVLGLQVGPRPDFPFPGCWLYQGPLDSYANAAVHVIGALDHVAFFATGLADMLTRLQTQGITPRRRDVPGLGLHQLFLDDPNGIVVELNYPFAEKQALDAAKG